MTATVLKLQGQSLRSRAPITPRPSCVKLRDISLNGAAEKLNAFNGIPKRKFGFLWKVDPAEIAKGRLWQLGILGYSYSTLLNVDMLEHSLNKYGVPSWLRLRAGEERTVENARKAIIGRLGTFETALEPMPKEAFFAEVKDFAAKRTDPVIVQSEALAWAAKELYALDTAAAADFYAEAVRSIHPEGASGQIEQLLGIYAVLFPKASGRVRLGKIDDVERDNFVLDQIGKLYPADRTLREECLEYYIVKFYAQEPNLAARLACSFEEESYLVGLGARIFKENERLAQYFYSAAHYLNRGAHQILAADGIPGNLNYEALVRFAQILYPDLDSQEQFIIALIKRPCFEGRQSLHLLGAAIGKLHKSHDGQIRFLINAAEAYYPADIKAQEDYIFVVMEELFFDGEMIPRLSVEEMAVFYVNLLRRLYPEDPDKHLAEIIHYAKSLSVSCDSISRHRTIAAQAGFLSGAFTAIQPSSSQARLVLIDYAAREISPDDPYYRERMLEEFNAPEHLRYCHKT